MRGTRRRSRPCLERNRGPAAVAPTKRAGFGSRLAPLAFLITGGNVADCTAAAALLHRLPDCAVVNADKATMQMRSRAYSRTRCARQHHSQGQQNGEALLLALSLMRPERHQAHVLPLERLPPHRHAIRPKRSQFPHPGMPLRRRQQLVMRPNPKMAGTSSAPCTK